MSNFAYFEQIEQRINILLSDKKFKEAYKLCKDFLDKFPEERTLIKLKEKVEEEIENENEKIVDEKLDEVKELFKAEKYPEILRELKKLLLIAPNNEKLRDLFFKAKNEYKEQIDKLQEKFNTEQSEKFNKLLETDDEKLFMDLYILEQNNTNNPGITELIAKYRDKIIEKKIKEKSDLLKSEKYEIIESFLDQLRKIDSKNPRIKQLEDESKKDKHNTQISRKTEFVYEGEKYLETLMKLKKYDKAIKVASELLTVDKTNTRILKILQKASNHHFLQTRDICIDIILANKKEIESEYSLDPAKFVRL